MPYIRLTIWISGVTLQADVRVGRGKSGEPGQGGRGRVPVAATAAAARAPATCWSWIHTLVR